MTVGIEGTPMFGNLTGVGQYSKKLIEAAAKQSQDADFEIVRQWWFFRKFQAPIPPHKHLRYHLVWWMPPIVYYQLYKRLPWVPPFDLIALRKYDVFIFTNYLAYPLRKKTRSIVTIYDLSYVYFNQFSTPKLKKYFNKLVPRSIRSASHIVTISENSKHEIMEYYKVSEEKIAVVNPAVDHTVFKPRPQEVSSNAAEKYKISKPYILSVCTLEPRKNLIGVLNAFEQLPEDIKSRYCLVLVGGKGWLYGELEAKFNKLSAKYSLIRTGYVPDEDLPALYSGASVFVYPSFYEGFGMPPLEAMACGVPVITSDNSSLPEVVGGAGIMVSANDTPALAHQIERVLTDKKLAGSMRAKGLEQAKKFTWDKSALKLIDVIEMVSKS
jgi:glycosyltransferase involved in cell wall biosynthesis